MFFETQCTCIVCGQKLVAQWQSPVAVENYTHSKTLHLREYYFVFMLCVVHFSSKFCMLPPYWLLASGHTLYVVYFNVVNFVVDGDRHILSCDGCLCCVFVAHFMPVRLQRYHSCNFMRLVQLTVFCVFHQTVLFGFCTSHIL